jgi:hypothetical protein
MTEPQIRLYRFEWGLCRKVLRARGLSPTAADDQRHELHIHAIGTDKSSLALTEREFDKILAVFRSISRSADLAPQIDAENQPLKRRRHVILTLCRQLGHDEGYAYGIAQGMARGDDELRTGKKKRGARLPSGDLDELDAGGLDKVIIALRKQVAREKEATTIAPEDVPF